MPYATVDLTWDGTMRSTSMDPADCTAPSHFSSPPTSGIGGHLLAAD